ncbi:MAG TPA: RecX family transcriptional regulator [Alphaproteobacteria bacterium]|nr:RecX family transcriptional regulator [Alphaproteobacteria bacterium]
MPIITSIKPQRSKKRVNIYLDDEFGFGIDLDNFVVLGLKINQELTQKEVEEIIKKAEFQKTLDKLLMFATLRPRSEKEIRDWFRRKEVHDSLFGELIARLKKLELLDDIKFAKWLVGQRVEFKSKSKRVIKLELQQKGIARDIIENILDETPIDEEKLAKELLEKKAYKWKGLEPRLTRQKMSQYLTGKGFGWDVISKALNNTDYEL